MSNDRTDDDKVSRAYREAARERTPTRLDAAVLDTARRGQRRSYSTSIRWLRPMAWAATIGLSLAIVIELSQVPEPDLVFDNLGEPAREAIPADAPVEGVQPDAPLKRDRMHTPPAQKTPGIAPMAPPDVQNSLEQLKSAPAALDEADTAIVLDADLEPHTIGATGAPARACNGAVVLSPESWLECIEDLERQGRSDEADEERRLLAEAFPDID